MNAQAFRAQFLADSVLSASPAKLLTMLYDRLALDLTRAEAAQRAGDRSTANENLTHAQDIVSELMVTLKTDAWAGAAQLHSLYSYLLGELMSANISSDPERTVACREIVEPLRSAWHEAAAQLAAPVPATVPAFAGAGAASRGLGELGVG